MTTPAKLFLSYSHDDEALLKELEKHLTLMRRQGVVAPWSDREINAGAELDPAIRQALEEADIILLLVSSSFLASDYCYSIEMKRALERHDEGSATVVPIILRPCEWLRSEIKRLKALPLDGKAVTTWSNRDEAFAEIARELRLTMERQGPSRAAPRNDLNQVRADNRLPPKQGPISKNVRLPEEFSDLQRGRFLRETFDFIATFFEGSLAALAANSSGIDSDFERVDTRTFIARAFKAGKLVTECSVHLGGIAGMRSESITYSYDASARGGGYNESLSVDADEQAMFLRSLGMSFGHENKDKKTQEDAAELLWSMFFDRLR
jgi:hypothetical protein